MQNKMNKLPNLHINHHVIAIPVHKLPEVIAANSDNAFNRLCLQQIAGQTDEENKHD